MYNQPLYDKKLPVLEAIVKSIPNKEVLDLDSITFVCVQHILLTTVNLMDSLVELGANPSNIHIMGKSYSFCPQVADILISKGYNYYFNKKQENLASFAASFRDDIKCMWEKVYDSLYNKKNIKLIVILDDGGFCLTNVPEVIRKNYSLVGIEQTTSGLTNLRLRTLEFPIVEVATSAAKQRVESLMIAEAVVKKLETVLPLEEKNLSCAVVGLGCIGSAVTKKLLSLNHRVKIYDKTLLKTKTFRRDTFVKNIETLFQESDYIFGCSGEDITKNLDIKNINKPKTFISCSSQDKEFFTLLQQFQQHNCVYQNILDHLECKINNQTIKILRGGFPINLDNSGESVAAIDIQLTRGLLLGGIIQGVLSVFQDSEQKKTLSMMLHPALQSFVISQWRLYGSTFLFSPEFLDLFQNLTWIQEHSQGVMEENELLNEWCFKSSTYDQSLLSKRYTA